MKIEYAKIRLYNKSPFLGTILFNLPVEELPEDSPIQTLATDGVKLYYCKKFWDKFENHQQVGLLAHEIFHIVFGHIWRKKNHSALACDPKSGSTIPLWNIATDYADNLMIQDYLGSEYTSKEMLLDDKYRGWSSEKIYEELNKNMKEMTPEQMKQFMENCKQKCLHDDPLWGKGSEKQQKETQEKMDDLVKQGLLNEKQKKGDLPAFLKRMWDEMQPKEDWHAVLRDYVEPFSNDYTFSPTDRRFLDEDFALPSIDEGERLDWVAVAIDTSGSIGQNDLSHFISEVRGILSAFDKVKAKLTFCDADATPFVDLDDAELSTIKAKGGGGTDFRPVFKMIEKEVTAPKALIYFSDLYGDFPSHSPDYDVVWISTSEQKAPIGRTLPYDISTKN